MTSTLVTQRNASLKVEYLPFIQIKAGWRGTIIAHADKPTPCVEFNEEYRGKPFLVDLDVANLEVVWESR
jgi:hypothetical protein